ncbi:MAG: sensor histidine kinase [Mucilaginibacter sp.]|nr:sensor histidine kinase [Mucilaginibacter sp.]
MDNIKHIVILSTLIFLLAPLSVAVYVIVYNRRKKKHIEEKAQMQQAFDSELLKTRIEMQEETLHHISQEIHDNITQVLSFVKLNLALTDNLSEQNKQARIKESRELIAQTISDLRDLSKSLSFEHIGTLGFVKTVEMEADRFNKSGILAVDVKITGDWYSLGEQHELLLFRILQESINNTIKHANAKQLKISLQYSEQLFNLTVEDDGAGFSTDVLMRKSGLGLKNMENRAALIGGTFTIDSSPGKGCLINISLTPLKHLNADGNHPDSLS